MFRPMMPKIIEVIFLLAVLSPGMLVAKINTTLQEQDPTEVKTSLAQVQQKIHKLEKKIYKTQHQEKSLTQELAELETEMGERSEQLRQLEKKKITHKATLLELQKESQQLAHSHQNQQRALSKLVQTTFTHHYKEKLQLLLSPQEWSSLARLNQYYQYFYKARAQHISALENDLNRVQLLQQHIVQEQQLIDTYTQNVKDVQAQLEDKKIRRTSILASLSKEMATVEEKLATLQQQEQHLSQLFKMLQTKLATTPTYIEPAQDFAKMKKRLSLPIQVAGAKLASIANAKSQSKKTYIDVPAGTPVNAIFPGRVVFAEWLRGVGLLMILDHGNGYMTLYGNNQKLYKGLGDWVSPGEMIARVGQSGGHAEPGLYFEIRKDGEAVDPTPWFKQA